MSVDWGEVAAEATAAINEVGFAATLLRPGVKSGSENSPTIGPPTEEPVTILQTSLDKLRKSGSLVEGAKAAYLVAVGELGLAPSTVDSLRVSGVDQSILKVTELAPGGRDLLYSVQVAS